MSRPQDGDRAHREGGFVYRNFPRGRMEPGQGMSRTAVGNSIVKVLKGTGSGYWMVLPALLAVLALVAYPLAFATYYIVRDDFATHLDPGYQAPFRRIL
jgi:hypothetical protein